MNSNKDIRVYFHAMDLIDDVSIAVETVELIEKEGLLDSAKEINVMMHFQENSFAWLKERWKNKTNVKYHLFDESYKNWYEGTTLHYIQEACHNTDEEFYVLNITSKGISHGPGGHQNWRKYMQYWNIEKWKECVDKLDEGYDTCGAAYLNNPPYPYYAGTFFWAKSSYIKRCKRMKTPIENNFKPQFEGQPHHRFDWECWIGSGDPKWYDMHPGEDNRWYLPRETYMNSKQNESE